MPAEIRNARFIIWHAAGVLNVILNLFFVIVLHMAAAGVATATAIAQYASAALIMNASASPQG